MTVLGHRYALGRLLDAGGMASVYEAHDELLSRRVAVKVFDEGVARDADARQRFLREARAAAKVSHPNAVAVFDAGVDGDTPYLVMQLVEGRPLTERLREERLFSADDAVAIVSPVLDALAAAHEQGVVHRDVKPANILLDADGRVTLIDFGIAKTLDGTDATTGNVFGTPLYVAPEQAAGAPATPPVDVYAVGVVLYELLSGAPPFDATTPSALVAAHQRAPVPALGRIRPDLPPELVAVVERALEKDSRRRYPDAAAMHRALAAVHPRARRAPPTLPLAPDGAPAAPRRQRTAMLALAALLLIALAGVGLSGRDASGPARHTPSPPPPTAWPTPDDLASLIALLEPDPARFGVAGPDLLAHLHEIADNPAAAGENAAETMAHVEEWAAGGRMDPELARITVDILAPLAAKAVDGDDDDHDDPDEREGDDDNDQGKGQGKGQGQGQGKGQGKGKD